MDTRGRVILLVPALGLAALTLLHCPEAEQDGTGSAPAAGKADASLVFKLRQEGHWHRQDESPASRMIWSSSSYFPWRGTARVGSLSARPGGSWTVALDLTVDIGNLKQRPGLVRELVVAVVGEQLYDRRGRFSALGTTSITPARTTAGVPIAHYYPGRLPVAALGDREASPLEGVLRFPASRWRGKKTARLAGRLTLKLPRDLPAGHYRPHVEVYALLKGSRTPITLGRLGFMMKFSDRFTSSLPGWKMKKYFGHSEPDVLDFMDSPQLLPAIKVGAPASPRVPWVIFHNEEYHGMSGLLSLEDQQHLGMLQRARLPTAYRVAPGRYGVEPGLPSLTPLSTLAGMFITPTGPEIVTHYFAGKGTARARLTGPDGKVKDLGRRNITKIDVNGARLDGGGFELDLRATGDYELQMTGTMEDRFGRTYSGGGTYRFTVAMPLSFSTAVKPGTNYIAGARYPAVLHINPGVPAEVRYEVSYYPNSDPARRQRKVYRGRANRFGHYVPDEPFLLLGEPGEYASRFEARFVDARGNLWMGSQASAGVVAAPRDPAIKVHGGFHYPGPKRLGQKDYGGLARYRNRRETPFANMDDLNWGGLYFPIPYHSGDTLTVAVTFPFESAVPNFLSMEITRPALARRFVSALNPTGKPYNFPMISTSGKLGYLPDVVRFAEGTYRISAKHPNQLPLVSANRKGLSPLLYPEHNAFETHAYLGIIRPGFQVLTIAFTGSYTQPYWDVSPSREKYVKNRPNGDLPGDIYRIMGGVVLKDRVTGKNHYNAYATAVVNADRGGQGNSVTAPGKVPIYTIHGRRHYYFMGLDTSARYLVGEPMVLGGTVMPPAATDVLFTVTKPDGTVETVRGRSNRLGQFSPPRAVMVDQPGPYRVRCKVGHGGAFGDVLGSGDGEFYHFGLPPKAPRLLRMDMPPVSPIEAHKDQKIGLSWPSDLRDVKLYHSLNMPGFVLDEGVRALSGTRHTFRLSIRDLAKQFPVIELRDYGSGKRTYADVIVVVLLLQGKRNGEAVFDSARMIIKDGKLLNPQAIFAGPQRRSLFPTDRTFFSGRAEQ